MGFGEQWKKDNYFKGIMEQRAKNDGNMETKAFWRT